MSDSDASLEAVARALCASYADGRAQWIGGNYHPSRDEILAAFEGLQHVFFPGYAQQTPPALGTPMQSCTFETLRAVRTLLARQIAQCLCARRAREADFDAAIEVARGEELAQTFMHRIADLRRLLLKDAQAALDGDPAASGLDEIILAYPGFLAVCVYRVAHELYALGVPLLPRILSEWAHAQTGADIHPAATIGESFFIDHATGVVIGETTQIGARVRLYQGVTLGALSLPRDASGRVVRQPKRHPTVEDDVTIYANATVLGGTTVLGSGAVIGGSVFLTKSVPPGARVSVEPAKLVIGGAKGSDPAGSFEI